MFLILFLGPNFTNLLFFQDMDAKALFPSIDPVSYLAFNIFSSILHRDHRSWNGVSYFFTYKIEVNFPHSSSRAFVTTIVISLSNINSPNSYSWSLISEILIKYEVIPSSLDNFILYSSCLREITSPVVLTENSSTNFSYISFAVSSFDT